MSVKRGYWAAAGAAIAVAGFMLSPAIGAGAGFSTLNGEKPVSLGDLGSMSSFTPSIKDPRLAAAYARIAASAGKQNFRFTPTSGSLSGQRSVTVMVRTGSDRVMVSRTLEPIDIKPVAFSLNAARNSWRKLALPEVVGRKALDPVPVETMVEAKNFSLDSARKERFSTKVLVENRREPGLRGPNADQDYSLGLASSYALTRNLNVTAGVRYNSNAAGRLSPMTDERQDAQALYLGTVLKF